MSMGNNPQNFTYYHTVHQHNFDPKNPNPPINYELVYATGTQTFYLLNPIEFHAFNGFSKWLQQPIENLTTALNLPKDEVSDEEEQDAAKNVISSRTAKIIQQSNAFNMILKNCIQGTNKNTIRELIWIPHDGSTPRFYYLTQDKLENFSEKYAAQDEATQKAIQNEQGGVSGSKLAQKLKNSTTGTIDFANTKWDDGIFTDLAKSLGINEEGAPKVFFGNPNDPNNVFVADADAQLLSFTGGTSIGLVAPMKGRHFSLSANVNASLILAKAEVNIAKLSLPCEEGYNVIPYFKDRNGEWQPFDMGHLRADLNLTLTGFTGASLMGCASVGYKMSKAGKIQVIGTNPGKSGNPDPTKDSSAGIITNGSAFIGAEAGCDVGCSLKWQNPEKDHDWDEVASLSTEGDVSAGAGFNASFCIGYSMVTKKFLVHAAAGITWGLGCSGSINLEVEAETILSFIQFIYHKIMKGNYSYIGMITDVAFNILIDAFTKSLFIRADDIIKLMADETGTVLEWWQGIRGNLLADIDLNQVFQIVNNINANPKRLTFTPPELKGRMLYILTDARIATTLFSQFMVQYGQRSAAGMSALAQPYLEAIETAVLTILSYIQTQADYDNLMTHMSLDPLIPSSLQEGENRLYNNLNVHGFSANRLAEFHIALKDNTKLAVYALEPPYNKPVEPNQDVLNIRGPITFI